MFLGGDAPLPAEYAFMPLDGLQRRLPDDAGERILSRSTARTSRASARTLKCSRSPLVVDIDHHHDNTRFGDVNLIDATASSTGEMLRDLFRELEIQLTPQIAEALYIALVTDTGRFQYTNTTPKSLRLAAELVEAGRRPAPHLPGRLRDGPVREAEAARARPRAGAGLRGRPARRLVPAARRLPGGRGGGAVLRRDHRLPARRRGRRHGRADPRAASRRGPLHRVSLRASHDELDVSAIARKSNGGGHRQAAGFSSEASIEEITEFVRREFQSAQSPRLRDAGRSRERSSPRDHPRSTSRPGLSSFAVVAELRRTTGARTGHAGTLDPFATGLLVLLSGLRDQAGAVVREARQAVRDRHRPHRHDRRRATPRAR